MNKSLKIGAVSGLIAGLIGGIFAFVTIIVGNLIGLYPTSSLPIKSLALGYIILNVIWGLILVIIYSMFYDLIPSKDAIKGLIFGLLIWLIGAIRPSYFLIAYAEPHWANALTFIGFFTFASYGLVLGTLYKKNRVHGYKRETGNIMKGIVVGLIAGAVGGIAVFSTGIIPLLGVWEVAAGSWTFGYLVSQAASHIEVNALGGALFGALYAKFYAELPKKGVLKGLLFGLMIWFITNVYPTTFFMVYSGGTLPLVRTLHYFTLPLTMAWTIGGLAAFVAFGLILGLLYRKPTEAIAAEKEIPTKGICRHCGTKIPTKSKFCLECGEKQ